MNRSFQRCFSLVLAGVFACPVLAMAQKAGYDLFQSAEGTSVDLTKLGLGEVQLQGVPINKKTLGNADTIIRRAMDSDSEKEGAVPMYVYALFLKSTRSVTFKKQKVDVYVTVNHSGGAISKRVLPQLDETRPSVGIVNISREGNEGGKFSSKLHVNADIILVKAGTNPALAANVVMHQAAPTISLTAADVPWAIKAPERYPEAAAFASGSFYPQAALRHHPHPILPAKTFEGPGPITTPR